MTHVAAVKQQAKAPLAIDEQRPFQVPGTSATVFVQRTRPDAYHVWVEQGGFVPGWEGTFDTEAEASAEYRRAIRAFHAHRTAAGIDRRRQALAVDLAEQHARMARRMHSVDRIDEIEAELVALETFGDRKLTAQLINSLAA